MYKPPLDHPMKGPMFQKRLARETSKNGLGFIDEDFDLISDDELRMIAEHINE